MSKIKFWLCLLAFIVYSPIAVAELIDCSTCSTQRINIADLQNKSRAELALLRNEIWARNGYVFKKPIYINYFSQQSWYQPKYNNAEVKLSKIAHENVALIQFMEKMAAGEAPPVTKAAAKTNTNKKVKTNRSTNHRENETAGRTNHQASETASSTNYQEEDEVSGSANHRENETVGSTNYQKDETVGISDDDTPDTRQNTKAKKSKAAKICNPLMKSVGKC